MYHFFNHSEPTPVRGGLPKVKQMDWNEYEHDMTGFITLLDCLNVLKVERYTILLRYCSSSSSSSTAWKAMSEGWAVHHFGPD